MAILKILSAKEKELIRLFPIIFESFSFLYKDYKEDTGIPITVFEIYQGNLLPKGTEEYILYIQQESTIGIVGDYIDARVVSANDESNFYQVRIPFNKIKYS